LPVDGADGDEFHGTVALQHVVRFSGFPRLDEAALKKLSHCKFSPGRDANGHAVGGTTELECIWKIH
jgi:hypothetical protein